MIFYYQKGKNYAHWLLSKFSFFLPQKEIDNLRAEEKLWDYAKAIRDLDKEFPPSQQLPKKGETEFSYLTWITFGA
jgi:hypothetical protein